LRGAEEGKREETIGFEKCLHLLCLLCYNNENLIIGKSMAENGYVYILKTCFAIFYKDWLCCCKK
jgi:hypothetical protein